MSKNNKHGRRYPKYFYTDITVHDYANAQLNGNSKARGRVKKGELAGVNKPVKYKAVATEMEDLSWFEKDLADFDVALDQKETESTEDEDQEEQEEQQLKPASHRRNKRRTVTSSDGVVFPIDLWFQLSFFIKPECVGTFARVCRGSNAVVNSVQFWKHLYSRHYRPDCDLPVFLQAEHLECVHGLRARVIRALFYLYPPLVDRSKTTVPFQNEPRVLVGQRCLLMWHKKVKNVWQFCFKFRRGEEAAETDSNIQRGIKSRLFPQWHQDLYYNPDNNLCILEVTCSTFLSLPMVMGQVLNKLYLTVSSGMRYHRLRLMFDTSLKDTCSRHQSEMTELVLDPVMELRVYPWWGPNFCKC